MLIGDLEIRLSASIARLQRDMDAARRTVGDATAGMSRAANAAKAALAGIGAGLGLQQLVQMTDQYAKFTAQLRLASLSAREYAAAYGDVKRISTAAQQDLQSTGMLYARIANGTRELGTTQKQVAAITETVNMALKVSGATATESASAQLQLSQAFASGTLRGEEFNAVNEAAPRLMLALADGIGVPVGALKKMAEAGEITSKIMADVLPNALGKLREEAKEVQTIAGAFTVLKNNMMEFVGIQANASGSVAFLTGAIGLLANNLGLLAGTMATLAVAKLVTMMSAWATGAYQTAAANRALATSTIATAVTSTEAASVIAASKLAEAQANTRAAASATTLAAARVAELRSAVMAAEGSVALAIATNGLIPAQARAIALAEAHAIALSKQAVAGGAATTAALAASGALTAQAAAGTLAARAMGLVSGAVAFLGGPLGAIITILGIGATAWMVWGDKSKEASEKSTKAVDESTVEMIARLDKQIEKLKERNRLQDTEPRIKKLDDLSDADKDGLARAKSAIDAASKGAGDFAGQSLVMRQLALIDLTHTYETALLRVGQAQDEVTKAATRGRDGKMAEWYAQNGTKAQQLAAELEKLKKQFGEIPPEMEKLVRAKYIDKGAAAAIKQEATAYQNLITSIGEKIAANKLEMSGFDKLTDAQKMTIKLDEAIASGKNKLTAEHIKEARAKIATVEAQDKAIVAQKEAIKRTEEMDKIQAAYAEQLGKSVEVANKESASNAELARTFGMTKSAIELLSVARMEEEIVKLRGIDMTDDEIAKLELLIDAKKRSAASLVSVDAQEANKKAWDQMTEDAKKASEQIGQSLTDQIMQGGKSAAEYLRDLFRTLVLRPILSPIGNAIGSAMTGMVMPGAAQASGSAGGSGAGSMAGSVAGSLFGAGGLAGSVMAGAGWLTGATTLGGSLAAAGSLAATGTMAGIASSIGMVAGALGPIALAIGAAVLIWKKLDTSGTYHTGGASSASAAGVETIRAESLGFAATRINAETEKMTAGLVGGIVSILDSTATAFGKTAGYTAATAFADDTSKDGAWGALLIGKLGETIVNWDSTRTSRWAPKEFGDGEAGQTQYLAALSASVRTALDGIGLPSWAQGMLDKVGDGASIEDIAKVVESINATQRALKMMGDTLAGFAQLGDAATSALIAASGGIEALASNASTYYANFYSESEKSAGAVQQITDALAAVGVAMPATNEAFRAQLEAQMALGEAGAPAVAAMLQVNDAFYKLHPATESLASATDALAESQRMAAEVAAAAMADLKSAASGLLGDVDAAFGVLQRVVEREKAAKANAHAIEMKAIQARIDTSTASVAKFKALSDSLRSTIDAMRMTGSEAQDRAGAQAQIAAAVAIARAGGALPGADSLKGALSILTQDSSNLFATMQDYQRDFYRTQNSLAELEAMSDKALSVEDRTLAAIISQKDLTQSAYDAEVLRLDGIITSAQEQIAILKGIDTSALSIAQAVQAMASSMLNANKNPIVAATASINSAYQSSLGRAPEAAGLQFWQDQAAGGMTPAAIAAMIADSPEAKVQELYKSVLGRQGEASGVDFWMKALSNGVSVDAARAAMMQSAEYKSIRGFASGGDHMGGLRWVGEDGPELEATGPSRIVSNRDLMASLRNPSESNAVLVAAVESLTATVKEQEIALTSIARDTKRQADGLEVVTDGFNALRTKEQVG